MVAILNMIKACICLLVCILLMDSDKQCLLSKITIYYSNYFVNPVAIAGFTIHLIAIWQKVHKSHHDVFVSNYARITISSMGHVCVTLCMWQMIEKCQGYGDAIWACAGYADQGCFGINLSLSSRCGVTFGRIRIQLNIGVCDTKHRWNCVYIPISELHPAWCKDMKRVGQAIVKESKALRSCGVWIV